MRILNRLKNFFYFRSNLVMIVGSAELRKRDHENKTGGNWGVSPTI